MDFSHNPTNLFTSLSLSLSLSPHIRTHTHLHWFSERSISPTKSQLTRLFLSTKPSSCRILTSKNLLSMVSNCSWHSLLTKSAWNPSWKSSGTLKLNYNLRTIQVHLVSSLWVRPNTAESVMLKPNRGILTLYASAASLACLNSTNP